MLAELSSGGLGKRGHALGSCHCGVAVRVSRFLQQVEGLDDVIALAAVGLALRALKTSQESIDAKRQRVARILGFWGLIAHMPTTVISRCCCSRQETMPTLASSRCVIAKSRQASRALHAWRGGEQRLPDYRHVQWRLGAAEAADEPANMEAAHRSGSAPSKA
ncbi:MAG TPA: hypothetical protein VD858_16830 [Reyranella sp.]|nr:hypothetical protein [Reyranella sp.]